MPRRSCRTSTCGIAGRSPMKTGALSPIAGGSTGSSSARRAFPIPASATMLRGSGCFAWRRRLARSWRCACRQRRAPARANGPARRCCTMMGGGHAVLHRRRAARRGPFVRAAAVCRAAASLARWSGRLGHAGRTVPGRWQRYVDRPRGRGKPGLIKAFRDPAWFRDPATGAPHAVHRQRGLVATTISTA